jgi:integrase
LCKPFEPITLHGARHTFAALMIRAGVNAKAARDLYGALLGGAENIIGREASGR